MIGADRLEVLFRPLVSLDLRKKRMQGNDAFWPDVV